MNRSYRPRLAALLLAQMTLASAFAGTVWDGGGATDTNVSNALNWDADTLPDFTGTSALTFATAGGNATIDTNVEATRLIFGNTFTIAAGAGALTVRGTNSGSNSYGLQATSSSTNIVVEEPILVKSYATASPLGNLFLVYNNRASANTTTFRINGGLALAPGSTVTTYTLRYGNNLTGQGGDTRIAGPITGLANLQNSSGNGAWSGSLIIAGDQAGVAGTDITLSTTGFLTPAATARLVLGETKDDDQTWRNVSLTNVMNLAIGGNITISGNLTTSATLATKITGIGADLASAGTLTVSNGTINTTCVIGGAGANENNLHLAKNTAGTLTLNGNHTYLGNTTVNAGTLLVNGALASPVQVKTSAVLSLGSSASLSGAVRVASGASVSGEGALSGGLAFDPGFSYLSFDPATAGGLTASAVTASGSNIVVTPAAAASTGTPYLVITSPGGLSGISFSGGVPGTFALQNSNTELWFTPTVAVAQNLVWTGADATNPSIWNVAAVPNWTAASAPKTFFGGDNVIFDDTGSTTSVTVQGTVSVGSATFNNGAKSYTVSGGTIGGSGAVIQSGSGNTTISSVLANGGGVAVNAGHLTLSGTNTFAGGLDVAGGTVSFTTIANLGGTAVPVDITSGGVLRYTGAATITNDVLGFTVGAGGGSFNLDTAANITLRLGGKISGSGAITKSGAGVLALGRSSDVDPGNDFTGALTVGAGMLDIRAINSLGATSAGTTVSNAVLLIQNFGQAVGTKTFAAEPLTFSGNAFLTVYGQEAKLFVNQLPGPITVAEGAVLGLSAARNSSAAISPQLELTGSGVTTAAGSTLSFGLRPAVYPSTLLEDAQTVNVTAPVTGPAAVVAQGTALSLYTLAAPGYSGATSVLGGTLRLNAANTANDASTVTLAAADAKLELNFSGTDTVARLFVGATQLDAGVYKAVGNTAATGTELAQITGTGTLTVTSGPVVATAYETWAAGFGLTGNAALAASDPDSDGLANILEYATGTSPVAAGPVNVSLSRSGAVLSLTYTRVADPSLTYTVEGTDDLAGTWTTVAAAGNPSTGAANLAGPVTIADSVATVSKRFLRLKVSY